MLKRQITARHRLIFRLFWGERGPKKIIPIHPSPASGNGRKILMSILDKSNAGSTDFAIIFAGRRRGRDKERFPGGFVWGFKE